LRQPSRQGEDAHERPSEVQASENMSERRQIRQLGDGDAVFVSMETDEAPSHIAALTLLDPSTSSSFGFERFLETLSERIDLVPRFKWKLREVPLGLDRAYWVEDRGFAASKHVERVAVPAPGDRAALSRLAGFLHARALDRSRPLWECWWIEGMEDGRIAILMKIHHCLMDGQSGIGLTEVLMDLSPEPDREVSPSQDMWEAPPRSPLFWEVARGAVVNGIRRQGRLAMYAGRAARDYLQNLSETNQPSPSSNVPRVSFNRRLSRDREFAFTTLPLQRLRDTKKHFDVRMNDVLLEIVSSSVRRGLQQLGDLPTSSLVALCPISLREPGDQSFGNQITSMPVTMATHLADPRERLAVIHASAERAKQRAREGAFEYITALAESLAPGALQLVMQAAHGVSDYAPIPANFVFSNVRGLPIPTYMAGARVEELYPMSMLQVANGLNVTAVTHDDQVDFGFLVDPKLIPDPWIFAKGVRGALEELEAATQELASRPIAAKGMTTRPRAATGPKIEFKGRPVDVLREVESGPEIAPEPDPLDLSLIMASIDRIRSAREEFI